MGEGVFSSGNWGLVVPGSSSGFLTALVILMESCTVEGSLLQLVLLLWPKIDRVPLRDPVVESMQARKPGLEALSSLAGSKTKITKLFGRLNVS